MGIKFGQLGSQKNNKVKATSRERSLAKRLGGRAVPASGAIAGMPGDIETERFLIDDKFTGQKAYTLTIKTLDKLTREANSQDKQPLLIIKFENGISKGSPSEWALIPTTELEDEFQNFEVLGKSTAISASMVNSLYKNSIKEEKEPIKEYIFYGVSLGVPNKWKLVPLQLLENRGYFG